MNGTRTFHLPRTAYSMNGAGGQYTIIDSENDLVIVRLGHRRGGKSRITYADRSLWAGMQVACFLPMRMVHYQEHEQILLCMHALPVGETGAALKSLNAALDLLPHAISSFNRESASKL